MFTWICPKCGNEVPPAYSECPNCASAAEKEKEGAAAPQEAAPAQEAAAPQESAPQSVAAPAPAPPAAAPLRAPNRIYVPGWALSLLFAAVFVIVGLTIILVKQTEKGRTAPAPAQSQAVAFENVTPPEVQTDPLLRNIEITGLRLTEDNAHKAFVQFVAINHSGADFGEISAKVEVKALTSKGGSDPVGTFSFKANLGPYESKDLKVPFETKLRVYELPDWQYLRAAVTGK
jgi:hypothetical protein